MSNLELIDSRRTQALSLMPEQAPIVEAVLAAHQLSELELLYGLYAEFQKVLNNKPLSLDEFKFGTGDPRDTLEIRRPTAERFKGILEQGLRPGIKVVRRILTQTLVEKPGNIITVSDRCMLKVMTNGFTGRYSPEECVKIVDQKSPEAQFAEYEQDTFKAAL